MSLPTKPRDQGLWLDEARVRVPCGGRVAGSVRPPSSKSVSHRMMNLVMLAEQPARIHHLLEAQDLDLFRAAFTSCGWTLDGSPADLSLTPPRGQVEMARVDCGNAGTMFRFLVASRCVRGVQTVIDGTPRLRERPIGPLVESLRRLGGEIEFLGVEGCAPLRVRGGSLQAGRTVVDAGESSQYLSALLMACAFIDGDSRIEVEALVSSPYVDVTLAAMARFGEPLPGVSGDHWQVAPLHVEPTEQPLEVEVEADYSAAAYPAAAAMITGGRVRLDGLNPASAQGDRQFLEVLVAAGGEMSWEDGTLVFGGRPQRALDIDLSAMPDQVPTLAAVAAFCPGTTIIRNVAHLRIKESDRLRAVTLEWSKIGINIRETRDGLEIEGRPGWLSHPGEGSLCRVATYDDHRIAMSAALVGLRRPLEVLDPGVVAKSYPNFWSDLSQLLSG